MVQGRGAGEQGGPGEGAGKSAGGSAQPLPSSPALPAESAPGMSQPPGTPKYLSQPLAQLPLTACRMQHQLLHAACPLRNQFWCCQQLLCRVLKHWVTEHERHMFRLVTSTITLT